MITKKKKKTSPGHCIIDGGNEWYENMGSDVQTYDSEAAVQITG